MMFDISKNKLIRTLLISLTIASIITPLMVAGFLDKWESKISDALYTTGTPLDDIVIVAIDDKSLQEIGRWPWPRKYFARAINYLNQSSVIGIDVSFFESAEGDSELANSLKTNKVVLAMEYTSFSYRNGKLYGESLLKPVATLGVPGGIPVSGSPLSGLYIYPHILHLYFFILYPFLILSSFIYVGAFSGELPPFIS
ncbi:MAG TPA: CHASE2 domain-containing protein [Thermoplasmatales archaeon]|nr:CHASE2 domain-containing protein [Thermoplasmatales archaeon]